MIIGFEKDTTGKKMIDTNKKWNQGELKSIFTGLNSDNKYEREYAVKVGIEKGFVEDDGHLNEYDFKEWLFTKIFNKEPNKFTPTEVLNLLDSEDDFKKAVALDYHIKHKFEFLEVSSECSEKYRKEIIYQIKRTFDPSIHNESEEEFYRKIRIADKEHEDWSKDFWKKHDEEERERKYFEETGKTEKENQKQTIIYITIIIFAIIGFVTVYNSIKDALN